MTVEQATLEAMESPSLEVLLKYKKRDWHLSGMIQEQYILHLYIGLY